MDKTDGYTDIPVVSKKGYHILAESTERGVTGIYHLKRLWGKIMTGTEKEYPHESGLDQAIINILGIGLFPTYQFLHMQRPDFESFEQWVIAQLGGNVPPEKFQQCNELFIGQDVLQAPIEEQVLSNEDLLFWEEHGYVIIRNAVSIDDCVAARKVIYNHLQMDEGDPLTWYKPNAALQGIMVTLYNDVAINKNRNSLKIRKAFEQVWKKAELIVTADKCGFNPPETTSFKYRGIGLHWDVSLARPIPFGTQGILYLTDTAANQGALTVVPGFHNMLETWLSELPANADPRKVDLSIFGPIHIAASAGDFIIWHHKLPHGSSPNKAKLPRVVQYINWYDPMQKCQEEWV